MVESKPERKINMIQTESTIDTNIIAKLIANIITDGDSNAYINKIIQNRKKIY